MLGVARGKAIKAQYRCHMNDMWVWLWACHGVTDNSIKTVGYQYNIANEQRGPNAARDQQCGYQDDRRDPVRGSIPIPWDRNFLCMAREREVLRIQGCLSIRSEEHTSELQSPDHLV